MTRKHPRRAVQVRTNSALSCGIPFFSVCDNKGSLVNSSSFFLYKFEPNMKSMTATITITTSIIMAAKDVQEMWGIVAPPILHPTSFLLLGTTSV
eukprot:TRINITY_DN16045_c0_g1_i1.p1 TRINITY_DN16045_c0_g1~~TRINITY_DN16045_c0_g1_i1.p1  ORF type:complete len:108 (-),score=13.67 TRINITY_DN16045_c0_g1_i1:82-366(-)